MSVKQIEAMILGGDILQQAWYWYWAEKAQFAPCGVPVLDEIRHVWNWVMANDIARGGVLVIVVLWATLSLLDVLLGARDKGAVDKLTKNGQMAVSTTSDTNKEEAVLTGEELRQELESLGKTQTELANELGVTRAYVSQIIKGTKPFTVELQRRCRQVFSSWRC